MINTILAASTTDYAALDKAVRALMGNALDPGRRDQAVIKLSQGRLATLGYRAGERVIDLRDHLIELQRQDFAIEPDDSVIGGTASELVRLNDAVRDYGMQIQRDDGIDILRDALELSGGAGIAGSVTRVL